MTRAAVLSCIVVLGILVALGDAPWRFIVLAALLVILACAAVSGVLTGDQGNRGATRANLNLVQVGAAGVGLVAGVISLVA